MAPKNSFYKLKGGCMSQGWELSDKHPSSSFPASDLNELPTKAQEPAMDFLGKLQPTQSWTGSYSNLCQC